MTEGTARRTDVVGRAAVIGGLLMGLGVVVDSQRTVLGCDVCPETVVIPAGAFLMGSERRRCRRAARPRGLRRCVRHGSVGGDGRGVPGL